MDIIKPAIISRDFNEIRFKIEEVEGLTDWVHVDVMDGVFTPNVSWSQPDDLESVGGKIKIEAHLMVSEPEKVLTHWINYVDRVIIHLESTEMLYQIIENIKNHSTKLGVALLFDTDIDLLEPYLPNLDFIQLMSIKEIGVHGNIFENEILNKVKSLRQIFPNGTIQLDGGVNIDNIAEIFSSSVNSVAVGTAVWQGDASENIKNLNLNATSRR